jgi:hypothetical protein
MLKAGGKNSTLKGDEGILGRGLYVEKWRSERLVHQGR